MWQGNLFEHAVPKKYSLAKLLRICKISVLEFFDKATKWVEMINGPRRLKDHINRVQSSLAVAAVVFKKLLPIFRKIFAPPCSNDDDNSKDLNCKKLFTLLWTLFIVMRKQFNSDDLMNSFHLLLCTVDFIFQDLRRSEMASLLDGDFINAIEMQPEEDSILETLCQIFEGVVLDAKHFRAHCWLPRMRRMSEEKSIETGEHLTNFAANELINKKKLDSMYEELIVKRGEMDERMFLPADISVVFDEAYDECAVQRLRHSEDGDSLVDADMLLRLSTQSCLERLQDQRQQRTPLTGRGYVISAEQYCPATPVSASLYNASRLEVLLQDSWRRLDAEVESILCHSCQDPFGKIMNIVSQLSERLEEVIENERQLDGADYDASFREMFAIRKNNTECLFSAVLLREDFLKALYVCSLQLVLFTYESVREFPWSLETMHLPAIHFYKVIELIIRADSSLSREMVKHLNKVEERVLEEFAWSLDSPLWPSLHRRADDVPSSQAVSLETVEGYSMRQPSLSQRYTLSPVKPLAAKRRLEFDDDDSSCVAAKRRAPDGESLTPTSATLLFFRKVYYLAAVRLRDLCERVRLDEKGRQRAWTLFEHVLRTETSLMAGRHLDQNLMCCLYVVAKIGQQNISFHDIMYHYRHQPQAASRVYRRVMVESNSSPPIILDDGASHDSVGSASDEKFRSESSVSGAVTGSGAATPEHQNVEYIDLIKYYNQIFISRVKSFVQKLQPGFAESGVSLLSIPMVQCNRLSPQRSVSDRITVTPMPSSLPSSPSRPYRYIFDKTPVKELNSINLIMHNAGRTIPQLASGGFQQGSYRNLVARTIS
ncbi:retinoblastoma-associated protein A domain-containing protein [Loa loa]|uniref:Retinoblastoma-associated protein A domain-containing protein n=1 Tax=Loa loa TaxID=7209 RepID=A0A1S0UE06_LOALO|nr:retinoblastoma-associated protein A domain-containing protein [Loa loa]EJD73805.1 retinoblastoma-associated protein A domain-containing protein [Loa loa]